MLRWTSASESRSNQPGAAAIGTRNAVGADAGIVN
jgi:hypothetical protein